MVNHHLQVSGLPKVLAVGDCSNRDFKGVVKIMGTAIIDILLSFLTSMLFSHVIHLNLSLYVCMHICMYVCVV